jgi:catechol 2,3-dioxygenase-like lactoylglutathione lyase family enzyme
MFNGLSHITLAVSDIDRSLKFYAEILGFTGHVRWETGAYLSMGDLWLCLSLDCVDAKNDYTHIALNVDPEKFDQLVKRLREFGLREWKSNSSEGRSHYVLDPDGHKLEVHSGSLASRLASLKSKPYKGLIWL